MILHRGRFGGGGEVGEGRGLVVKLDGLEDNVEELGDCSLTLFSKLSPNKTPTRKKIQHNNTTPQQQKPNINPRTLKYITRCYANANLPRLRSKPKKSRRKNPESGQGGLQEAQVNHPVAQNQIQEGMGREDRRLVGVIESVGEKAYSCNGQG